jgi:hypothetical protein
MGLDNGAARIPNFKIRPIQVMRPDDRNIPLRVLQEEEARPLGNLCAMETAERGHLHYLRVNLSGEDEDGGNHKYLLISSVS